MKRVLTLLLLSGCPPPVPPPVPRPVVIIPGAGCAEACERMRALECELGRPTPAGHSCEDVCENTLTGPRALRWDTECLAAASSCDGCDPAPVR